MSESDSMVERVAMAICHQYHGDLSVRPFMEGAKLRWAVTNEIHKDLYRNEALAAISAMREPTEAMIEPGALAGEMYGNTDAEATWRAMIDAALSKP